MAEIHGTIQVNKKLIKRLRAERGWSQRLLADEADVGIQTIKKAERGETLRYETIKRIADALMVSPELLWQNTDKILMLRIDGTQDTQTVMSQILSVVPHAHIEAIKNNTVSVLMTCRSEPAKILIQQIRLGLLHDLGDVTLFIWNVGGPMPIDPHETPFADSPLLRGAMVFDERAEEEAKEDARKRITVRVELTNLIRREGSLDRAVESAVERWLNNYENTSKGWRRRPPRASKTHVFIDQPFLQRLRDEVKRRRSKKIKPNKLRDMVECALIDFSDREKGQS